MIIKKITSFLFIFAFMIALSGYIAPKAQAAPIFPSGCSSAVGYSTTNGNPCNGTSSASQLIAGCTNVLGYSIASGLPCSGTTEAIFSIEGCSTIYGYSITNGNVCNGTNFATFPIDSSVITPNLPTTGVAGMTTTSAILLSLLGLLAICGIVYATRKEKSV